MQAKVHPKCDAVLDQSMQRYFCSQRENQQICRSLVDLHAWCLCPLREEGPIPPDSCSSDYHSLNSFAADLMLGFISHARLGFLCLSARVTYLILTPV